MAAPVIFENCGNFKLPANEKETGFPFDDIDYDTNDHLQSTLNNIAQRHPEFASHLSFDIPTLRRKRYGSNSSTDREDARPQTPGNSSRSFDSPDHTRFPDHSFPSGFKRFPFTRDFDDFSENLRTEEKPPEIPRTHEKRGRKFNPNLPQHLSNTVDLGQKQTPVEENRGQRSMSAPPENRATQSETTRSNQPADMGSYLGRPTKMKDPKEEFSGKRTNTSQNQPKERIIPIFVEGRGHITPDPKLKETKQKESTSSSAYEHSHSDSKIPSEPVHHPTYQPEQPPTKPEETVTKEESKPCHQEPPPSNGPLDKIRAIEMDVVELKKEVDVFKGTRKDKHYIYLDEMLTRNLLKLDLVDTEGNNNIRLARREIIKCIQDCINKLEENAIAFEESQKNNETQIVSVSAKGQPQQEEKAPVEQQENITQVSMEPDEPENKTEHAPVPVKIKQQEKNKKPLHKTEVKINISTPSTEAQSVNDNASEQPACTQPQQQDTCTEQAVLVGNSSVDTQEPMEVESNPNPASEGSQIETMDLESTSKSQSDNVAPS